MTETSGEAARLIDIQRTETSGEAARLLDLQRAAQRRLAAALTVPTAVFVLILAGVAEWFAIRTDT